MYILLVVLCQIFVERLCLVHESHYREKMYESAHYNILKHEAFYLRNVPKRAICKGMTFLVVTMTTSRTRWVTIT